MLKVYHSVADNASLVKTLQQNYPAIDIRSCELLAMGCTDNYLLKGKRKKYVFRLYRKNWWPKAEIDGELQLLEVLTRNKLDVCKPIRADNDKRYISVKTAEGTRYGALFDYIPGRHLGHTSRSRHANLRQLGEMTARMHMIADTIDPPVKRWTMDFGAIVPPFLKAASSVLSHREKDLAYLNRLAVRLEDIIFSQPEGSLDFGLCHGDLHVHNVMLGPEGKLTIFDFDWCSYSYRAYDLATVWWSLPREEKSTRLWKSFLNAYLKQRKLSKQEKQLMPWFVILRQFELLNFHLSVRDQFGSAWQNDDYYDARIGFFRKWTKQHQLK